MDIWKSKVLPKIKLILVKTGGKKAAAAAEIVKSWDESKEGINGEFEEKKAELQPKVVEIYESVPAPLKVLIKERSKVSWIKKNSPAITKFFKDLANIDFPGAKQLSEGISKVGPALLSGPIFATFQKVSMLLPVAAEEEAPAATTEEEAAVEEKKEHGAAVEETKEEAAASADKEEEAEEKNKGETPAAAGETTTAETSAPPLADASADTADPTPEAGAPTEGEPAKAEEETPKA